jgi:uroporphyrin-III C-methyltransferase
MKGKVYLVGAGPGDPELLTLKALRLLKTADVLLHDDLVPDKVLALTSPLAQRYNVGKRCGVKKIRQEEINFLMISLAGAGLTVVRLKSGDPLIFGRCGEELEALRRAGIECEIVPGVTAALGAAAAAQIPLTHRRISHSVVFLTGHGADDSTDWKLFVSQNVTLAIYMPGSNWKQLATRLIHAGLSSETPCAVMSCATTAGQQVKRYILRTLRDARAIQTPALLIVGDVVKFAYTPQQTTTVSLAIETIAAKTRPFEAVEEIQ